MKTCKSIPISKAASVDIHQVNVAIDGIDCSKIKGSFRVHLLKDGQRIASRFMCRPSQIDAQTEDAGADAIAHFDFLLPFDAVADGKLSAEVERVGTTEFAESVPAAQMGNPRMSVYLILTIE